MGFLPMKRGKAEGSTRILRAPFPHHLKAHLVSSDVNFKISAAGQ
jgi:hypothetical protein